MKNKILLLIISLCLLLFQNACKRYFNCNCKWDAAYYANPLHPYIVAEEANYKFQKVSSMADDTLCKIYCEDAWYDTNYTAVNKTWTVQ